MGKVGDSIRLYSGRDLKDRARMWVKLHPRMSDYMQQAPVLVLMHDDTDARVELHRACERGAKLRDIMEIGGFNVGLRKLHPHSLRAETSPAGFFTANPSAIAQQVAKRNIAQQTEWQRQLDVYKSSFYLNQDRGMSVQWMAENLPPGEHDMRHYADIPASMLEECGVRKNWRWRDFMAAMKRWEESYVRLNPSWLGVDLARDRAADVAALVVHGQRVYMTNARGQRQVVEWGDYYNPVRHPPATFGQGQEEAMRKLLSQPLTPHVSAPTLVEDHGLSFHLLNTTLELDEEGVAMLHCVGSYSSNVKGGHSLIYSIRKDGKRVATMEISPSEWEKNTGLGPAKVTGWCIEQVKGVRNAAPDAATMQAARAFAAAHFKMVERRSTWDSRTWAVERFAMRTVRPNLGIIGDATA